MTSEQERAAIVAWLRSHDVVEQRIADGSYIRFSTAHGEDRDRNGHYQAAADEIECGAHLAIGVSK